MNEKYKEKIYRSEWKYLINTQDMNILNCKISKLLTLDIHTPKNGRYIIHSLYFDNIVNDSLYDCESGSSKKYKWRIRYYGDDLNYIVLEKKEKENGEGNKKSCLLSLQEFNSIFSGNIMDIAYDTDKKLIKEFSVDILVNGYKPEIIIDYERIAYVEDTTNVRITFDMKISASYDLEEFLKENYEKFYILPSNINLLEVKFDYILPSYIKKVLNLENMDQTAFSKYYFGRKIIDSYIR